LKNVAYEFSLFLELHKPFTANSIAMLLCFSFGASANREAEAFVDLDVEWNNLIAIPTVKTTI
jgi:hypothetical protein